MAYFDVMPSIQIVWLPFLMIMALATGLGAGLWMAALNVVYRDIRYVVPFFVQLWMFATPIAYPSTLVPQEWRSIYAINPMVGVVEGFRWALLGTDTAPGLMILPSSVVAFSMLASGAVYFRRMERHFADVV